MKGWVPLMTVAFLASWSRVHSAGTMKGWVPLMTVAFLASWSRVHSAGCGSLPADIEFLLDTSGSVGSSNFAKVRDFVKKFAQSFDIGANGVHIGISTFDTHPRNEFWLNQHTTKASLETAIGAVRYPSGNTNTADALEFIRQNAFTKAHGDRDRIANILIVMTDGKSNNKASTLQQAALLKKSNINIFALGVGSSVDHDELNAIASSAHNVFTITNFNALDTIQAELKKTACEVNGNWSPWGFYSPCSKSCGGGTQYRERTCTDPAPANNGKDCVGQGRETKACNTKACPTKPPPTTTTKPITTTTPIPGCGVQPADILFIVDASGSVGTANFHKTLGFIQNMTSGFQIGPHDIQIGMITFDTKPYLQFHFNKFNSKNDVVKAEGSTKYTGGGTYTHLALKYATDTSFTTANGARPGAAKIAIVITDGKSANAGATSSEAARLRAKGVTVFSIGVGTGPKETELKAMATDPDNEHVFVVNNFDALSLIKGALQKKACQVKPTMAPTPAPTQASCGGKADFVFLLDKSGSVGQTNFNKMLEFVKDVSSHFTLGPNDVQVGVDTYSTSFNTEFTLGKFGDAISVNHAVDSIPYSGGGTNTGPAITQMTSSSFTTAAGHRAGVPKIAVVVTDGKSNNPHDTVVAAQKARDAGIHMLAIGVGSGVDDKELDAIASDPDSQNVYKAATFDTLKSLRALLAAKACEQVQQTPQNQKCGTKADIVFMLDSSGSVGSTNFKLLLSFVNSLTKDWDIGPDSIHIGVEKFSSRPYTEFHLNKFTDKQQMLTAINNIKYQSGGTNTGDALGYMKNTMFNTNNGDRPNVPNIGIIITDGRSNHPDKTKAQAEAARKAGITLFSVGVGSGISKPELNEMATDPDSSHVFTVTDFSKLAGIKALFQQQTCGAIPTSVPPYVPTAKPPTGPLIDTCQDHIPNCKSYDPSVCAGFIRWAQDNCPRYCGFCSTAIPTTPPPCVDVLKTCPSYEITSCITYKPWALDNCRKYCGYCVGQTVGTGYFGKCFYKGQQYGQGEQWSDGCAYDCECSNAATGFYQCYNKCPTYYNLPPQCTLVQQSGTCCLQPVCNFDAKYQTTSGQHVGDLNGNKVCVYNGRKYYQSQTWSVGCDLECICDDAGVGLYSCQSKCASYGTLPANCKLVKAPGQCCAKPECEFNTQVGTFTGKGQPSGPGDNGFSTTPPPCVDKLADCASFDQNSCTADAYRPWALANCRKTCNLCNTVGVPGPNDKCVYKGMAYKQGQQWDDGCDKTCVCENAAFGYYRCDSMCPSFYNMPPGCVLVPVAGQCCKAMRCDSGTITGSQTVPNTIGGVPLTYIRPTLAPGLMPGGTLAPGQTIPPYLTPVPGMTLAPGIVPGQTLAPGVTIPWYLTPAPGMTYAPTPFTSPAPLIPGQTLPPGQTIPPYITPVPGQTFAPNIIPGQTLSPGLTVPWYLTPRPGQTYAPQVTNPYATPAPIMPGRTLAPGQTLPPYITPAPGQTFGPGIIPGQTLAPGMTVPAYLTPRPGQTYAPGMTPPNTPAPLIPGLTLPPGQTIPPYITPLPGQTFAPGIRPGQTLAPGVTVPNYLTPQPGQTYAPGITHPSVPLIPGITLPPGQTIPSYITPLPGQTFAPGIVPGQTLAPGVTVPSYLTPRPYMTYAPDTTPRHGYAIPGLRPGNTLAPGVTIPSYITPPVGQTFAPGIRPGQTLAPGMTVPPNLTPAPGQTYAPDTTHYPRPGILPGQTLPPGVTVPSYITPAPGQTFAPGIRPGQTLAPGVTIPSYLTPAPGHTYAPDTTQYPRPGIRPGQTLRPGQTIPSYITPAPGHTFAPGIIPGRTLAPGMTVPANLTPRPGRTYAPDTTQRPRPGLIPGLTLPPGQTVPSYITPAPGQTFAPGIRPGQTLAPGMTVPPNLTPRPGQTYAPDTTHYPIPGIVPGQPMLPGQTVPSYITPPPGQTFAPGIVPGQTLAPGMTVPPNLTPAPGQTYAPDTTPGLQPGQTLAPGQKIPSYVTPAPGQTFAPGIVPGQTLAPGVTVPPNMTPQPGQTYAPGTTLGYAVPGLRPGATLPPGQTVPSYITPAPGQTFAPGIRPGQPLAPGVTVPLNLTPRPGQTYAPDTTPGSGYPIPGIRPGGTLAPGQTIPPYATPQPGQTFAPGIVPGQPLAPGVTVPWNLTPRPGQTYPPGTRAPAVPIIPGQTLSPGQTLPVYITPAPGHTFAPGIMPGQTLAPGVTVPVYLTPSPGQTYAPYPTVGLGGQVPGMVGGQVPGMTGGQQPGMGVGQIPGMTGGQTPGQTGTGQVPGLQGSGNQKLSGCVYKNTLYQQGQRWSDGCDFSCVCEDGNTGRYRCSPKCLAFNNLDAKCTLQDDPNDPCCKTPNCPADVTVVPNIGKAVTGFSPAINPNVGGTVGGVPGGSQGGLNPGTVGSTSSSVSGQRKGCVYKGQVYQKGATWKEGCQYSCKCEDDTTGFYSCTDLCPNYQNLPATCRLIPDPQNSCCQTYVCDVKVTTTASSVGQGGVPTPATGVNYCVYNGRYYRQGEEWEDGCSLKCRCEDAKNQYHQCTARCPAYSSVPLGCRMVPNPKDPQCCKMPECDSVTGQPGSGISGSQTPLGFIGTYAGNGRPNGAQIASTGYRSACIYKGQIHAQGTTWQDGCDLDCECVNAQTGVYRCTDRCPQYAALPSGCNLVQDPNDRCCVKAECAPPTNGQCRDVKDNCFSYGKYSCQAPYTAWAKDNCAYYCGFCGVQTTQAPANCQDKIPNCPDYGKDGCVGTFEAWARYNCPKFCGYCGANSQVTTASSVISVSGQPGQGTSGSGQVSGSCQDKLPNCDQYGQESCNDPYRGWAIANCAKRCNLCSSVGQGSGLVTGSQGSVGFTGLTLGCFYNGRIYAQSAAWQDGCDYNCTCVNAQTGYYKCSARCLTYDHLPAGCVLQKPTGECCSRPVCNGQVTGQTKGCMYKGQVHPQDTKWNDGCDYKCTCQDGATGRYQCTARCVQWNLPSACSLTQPATGKCCPTPKCPAGFTINYPPGYVAE